MTNNDVWGFDTEDGNTDPISELSKQNKQALYDIQKMVKQKSYENNLDKLEKIVNELKPNQKNQEKANEIREIISYFSGINNQIHTFLKTGNEILLNDEKPELDNKGNIQKYDANGKKNSNGTLPDNFEKPAAIYNFEQAFTKLYGSDKSKTNHTYTTIDNLQSFLTEF